MSQPYRQIRVAPITPAIGAEISGVTIGADLDAAVIEEIKRALHAHLVIFFHDQNITPLVQRDFAARFGTLQTHPFLPALPDFPQLVVLENDREHPPQVNFWHADVTFMEKPPLGSILLAREMPAYGGDTLWASMYAAYEALSDRMQRLLQGLTAEHVGRVAEYETAYGKASPAAAPPRPAASHPVVRTHPVTGRKALYVHPAATVRIVELSERESSSLLQTLYSHVQTPEFQVRFRWQPHSIAFWDNRCTQHYALADYWPARRVMHRATLDGDKPV